MEKKFFLVLGNQLFDPRIFREKIKGPIEFFMKEDNELATHYKYHKHKIIFFFSAMRKYRLELESHHYLVHYEEYTDKGEKNFAESLNDWFQSKKIKEIHFFEIEDKFFEKKIIDLCANKNIKTVIHSSWMFLTSRDDFKKYLSSTKKPFMKTFYESQRKRFNLLVDKQGKPFGGQWSFDEENRKSLPKDFKEVSLIKFHQDQIDQVVIDLVEKRFPDHPGRGSDFWLPTDRVTAQEWLSHFIEKKLKNFGPYEDALSDQFEFINHSVLTPFLNVGLITPRKVIYETIRAFKESKERSLFLPLNSVEGFVRQIIGWREFVRGIYQNFSEQQEKSNFFNHQKKLTPHWYQGNTGIAPLDDVIKKTLKRGYAHHIERLMVVGSLMLLLEIHPEEVHRWFMEMFIDSSDWVMGPNVFGMAIFSDGGIFATKPYFCGSNYYRKMGPYKKGDWQLGVDGLYWGFIDKNRDYFLKNHRLSMMVKTFDKMEESKKKSLKKEADLLRKKLTI